MCKLEFADNLWLPFLDRPQSDIVVFAIITFQIYKILLTKWNHVIGPNNIITLNEWLENIPTSIIELADIDESSHEEVIVIFIIIKEFLKIKNICLTEADNGNCFEFSYS